MKEVKISKAKAFEIDPNKKYFIIVDKYQVTQEYANKINKQFKLWGAEKIVEL